MQAVGSNATQPSSGAKASAQAKQRPAHRRLGGRAIAADEARRDVSSKRAQAMKTCAKSRARRVSARRPRPPTSGSSASSGSKVISAVERAHQPVQALERVGAPAVASAGEVAQARRWLRASGLARRIHLRRQRLDRAAHHARPRRVVSTSPRAETVRRSIGWP